MIRVRVHVSPLLRQRIPHVIRANQELGREKVAVDPDHPIEMRMLLPEMVEIRSFQLVVWNDGRIDARAMDANWRMLRCRSWQRLAETRMHSEDMPVLTR